MSNMSNLDFDLNLEGSVEYLGEDLLDMDVDERACEGVFLAFQYPVELPGVNNTYFLKSALNAQRKYRDEPEIDAMEFMELIGDKIKLLNLKESLLKRPPVVHCFLKRLLWSTS